MVIKPKYTRCGDYLLPEMGLSEEDKTPLGRYGEMRCRFLEENRPGLFTRLLLSGQLMHQLHEVDRAAEQRMETMLPQMAQNAGLTEAMKNSDPLKWAGIMNTLSAQAEEMILEELVYG